jgi:hypothetical protein
MVKNDRFNWVAPLGAAVAGAIGGAVFWYTLRDATFNGRPIVARLGWPLETPVVFAAVGAIVGALAAVFSNRRAQSLRADLGDVAVELGLAYEPGDVKIAPEARPRELVVGAWGRCQNRLSGSIDGVPAQMFDLTTVSQSGEDAASRHWTSVLFGKTRLPPFACIPKHWSTVRDRSLTSSVNFDQSIGDLITREAVADFQKTYHLCVPDTLVRSEEDEVRGLFRLPRLEALAKYPGWYIQSADGCLLAARSGAAPATDRPALWHEAIEIRRALLAPVSSALLPIPAAPGMERDRERARQIGRSGGALVGVVAGFFGSFIAFAASTFGRGRAGHQFVFAIFPLMIGGVVVGALVGRTLGGRLADRSYRPSSDGAPAPQVSIRSAWGWIIAGSFLGWIVGGIIAMGLATTVLPKKGQPGWWVPIAFFSPPAICFISGGVAGYRVAQGRAVKRERAARASGRVR